MPQYIVRMSVRLWRLGTLITLVGTFVK